MVNEREAYILGKINSYGGSEKDWGETYDRLFSEQERLRKNLGIEKTLNLTLLRNTIEAESDEARKCLLEKCKEIREQILGGVRLYN